MNPENCAEQISSIIYIKPNKHRFISISFLLLQIFDESLHLLPSLRIRVLLKIILECL